MSEATDILETLLEALQADKEVLREARARRDAVLAAAGTYQGALRVFGSGSVAHLTVIRPVSDADCGVVLKGRSHPTLGPDGDGIGCRRIVDDVADHVAAVLAKNHPGAAVSIPGKRAILVQFQDPTGEDAEDPSVDLVVGLTRANARGLWIPNRWTDAWDASDPEEHTRLFLEGEEALRRVRRRCVRLAKGWSRQFGSPPLCSFNIEALAHEAITGGSDLATALQATFAYGAKTLAISETPDPAGVSPPIRVEDRSRAVALLGAASDGLSKAIEATDGSKAHEALASVFFEYLENKNDMAQLLRVGGALTIGAVIGAAAAAAGPTVVKAIRSFGGDS
jgi:hypothetical protein